MPSLRDIQDKITGVKKTRQITRAMNMVATAKLRGVQERTERFKPYADKFAEVLGSLSSGLDPESHPLLSQPEEIHKVAMIQFSADRGLCGSFNMNLFNAGNKFLAKQKAAGHEVDFYVVGRRARDFFKRKYEFAEELTGAMNVIDFDLAVQVARMGLNAFLSGEVQEVYLVYTVFHSIARQENVVERLLPISPDMEMAEEAGSSQEYLIEPSAEEILVDLLPRYLNVRMYSALLNTVTSEHAARMTAMDNATKNCKDMVDNLTLLYNKARQAAVTAELMDIVGGAEAVKG